MYTYILYDPCVVLPSDWDPGFAAKTMDKNLMAWGKKHKNKNLGPRWLSKRHPWWQQKLKT